MRGNAVGREGAALIVIFMLVFVLMGMAIIVNTFNVNGYPATPAGLRR